VNPVIPSHRKQSPFNSVAVAHGTKGGEMEIKVVDLSTGEVVLETANPINLGITFNGVERLTVS